MKILIARLVNMVPGKVMLGWMHHWCFHNLPLCCFDMTPVPGAGRRDNAGNGGGVLMVHEACRFGSYLEEPISQTCRIPGRLCIFSSR